MPSIPFEQRLAALGLTLDPAERPKLAVLVAELDVAAASVRTPRAYAEEPMGGFRLGSASEPSPYDRSTPR